MRIVLFRGLYSACLASAVTKTDIDRASGRLVSDKAGFGRYVRSMVPWAHATSAWLQPWSQWDITA